jgi:ribosomal protein S18 acetylase RimI-like enzyme
VIDGDGWYRIMTPSTTFPAANEVYFCNLRPQGTDAHIAEVIADYHSRGLPLTWCVYPWTQPDDLGARLLARGATAMSVKTFLGSTSLPLAVADGVAVEAVDPSSAEGIDTYLNLLSSGYGLPADEESFRRVRYRQLCAGPRPVMHLVVAYCDGVPAGCAGMVIKPESAHLTTGRVLPAFQGRGVFQSLIATLLAKLRALGITLASGHSNEQSAFWVERFGFRFIYPYTIYELPPPA